MHDSTVLGGGRAALQVLLQMAVLQSTVLRVRAVNSLDDSPPQAPAAELHDYCSCIWLYAQLLAESRHA